MPAQVLWAVVADHAELLPSVDYLHARFMAPLLGCCGFFKCACSPVSHQQHWIRLYLEAS